MPGTCSFPAATAVAVPELAGLTPYFVPDRAAKAAALQGYFAHDRSPVGSSRIQLCPMPAGSQESHGFVQPLAAVAFAVTGVGRLVLSCRPDVFDGRAKRLQELSQRRIGPRRCSIEIQPATGLAEMTGCALAVVLVEVTLQMTIGEIDFALDDVARVIEKRDDIARNRARIPARERWHHQPLHSRKRLFH